MRQDVAIGLSSDHTSDYALTQLPTRSLNFINLCLANGQMPAQPLEQPALIFASKLMLPNTDHAPAMIAQGTIYSTVTSFIIENLFPPESGICLGLGSVLGTAMPKTAVHEHR